MKDLSTEQESDWEFRNLHTFLPSKANSLLNNSGLLDLSKSDRLLQVNP
jgi:hypothetical protein